MQEWSVRRHWIKPSTLCLVVNWGTYRRVRCCCCCCWASLPSGNRWAKRSPSKDTKLSVQRQTSVEMALVHWVGGVVLQPKCAKPARNLPRKAARFWFSQPVFTTFRKGRWEFFDERVKYTEEEAWADSKPAVVRCIALFCRQAKQADEVEQVPWSLRIAGLTRNEQN